MRKKTIVKMPEEPNYDLDLAPMLAMMVALIPILLLSTVFVKVKIIESPLPQVIQEAIAEDQNKGERKIEISLEANLKGFTLVVNNNGKKQRKRVAATKGDDLNIEGLKRALIAVKKRYPRSFQLLLKPGSELTYKQIVQIMDAARDTGKDGPRFTVKSSKSDEEASTNLLFPKVVFGNLMEG
jgi:biopolymer transport protein ExbD